MSVNRVDFQEDRVLWEECSKWRLDKECYGILAEKHHIFKKACRHVRLGNCDEWLREKVIKGFLPPHESDGSLWERCKVDKGLSAKHCRGEIKRSHELFMCHCQGTFLRPKDACKEVLQNMVIQGFDPK